MMKSLVALGFRWETLALQGALLTLCATEQDCGIDATAQQFWREAAAAA
jgi:hypothetical protein